MAPGAGGSRARGSLPSLVMIACTPDAPALCRRPSPTLSRAARPVTDAALEVRSPARGSLGRAPDRIDHAEVATGMWPWPPSACRDDVVLTDRCLDDCAHLNERWPVGLEDVLAPGSARHLLGDPPRRARTSRARRARRLGTSREWEEKPLVELRRRRYRSRPASRALGHRCDGRKRGTA